MPSLSNRQRNFLANLSGYAVMLILIAAIGAPLYWMLTGAVKTSRQIYTIPHIWLPTNPRWENFSDAWNAAPFGRFYLNTIVLTTLGTAIKLFNAVLTAYALVFLKFPKKNLIFNLLLAGLMIPEQVTINQVDAQTAFDEVAQTLEEEAGPVKEALAALQGS
jgi:sn-glycerol 3-phosphate transport system permease protein